VSRSSSSCAEAKLVQPELYRDIVIATEPIKDGFDFLGWNIRKYNGKLLMKPSKANVKAHLDKIREIIKANKTAKQASLIRLLNPVLRGWANYHSHVVAKKAFDRVDHEVWSMLWMGGKKAP